MITRVYLRNYRNIGEIDLELGEFTALVGPNASGKSNIADALRFLSDCVRDPLGSVVAKRQGFDRLRRLDADSAADVTVGVEVRTDEGLGIWAFTLRQAAGGGDDFEVTSECAVWQPGGTPGSWAHQQHLNLMRRGNRGVSLDEAMKLLHGPGFFSGSGFSYGNVAHFPPSGASLTLPLVPTKVLEPLITELRRMAVYWVFPNKLRAPQEPNPVHPMTATGDNWASTLASMNKRRWGGELLDGLGRIAGDIDDYRIAQAGGFLIPEFRHGVDASGRERWLGAAQESDGTLRIAAILTALFQEPAPSLLGFEEPELAVHPGAIPLLFDFLKEASTRSQILLTTHSPDLLDLLSIDDIRVVERRGGATTVSRVEERQRELVRKRLMSTSDILHAEGLRPEGAGGDG